MRDSCPSVSLATRVIREVFLGATVRDLASYRSSVCDAIRKVRASIFLQEDWAESAADVSGGPGS